MYSKVLWQNQERSMRRSYREAGRYYSTHPRSARNAKLDKIMPTIIADRPNLNSILLSDHSVIHASFAFTILSAGIQLTRLIWHRCIFRQYQKKKTDELASKTRPNMAESFHPTARADIELSISPNTNTITPTLNTAYGYTDFLSSCVRLINSLMYSSLSESATIEESGNSAKSKFVYTLTIVIASM